jgi:dTDP-4-amino-4,6-dideoxygalactose transaminase
MMVVPFHRPYLPAAVRNAILSALNDRSLCGGRENTKRLQELLCKLFAVKHALFTTSCTHAMELSMLLLGLEPGDEVIMPSFTFVSTANAVALRGARPVFAEIDPCTLNIDPADARRRITERTRGILPVHYAGVACEMEEILELAREFRLWVVEDAAHGIDAQYKGCFLGTLGQTGCFSFHETKNIVCGEGGALLTNDEDLFARAEVLAEKGTNRSAFLRGSVDKYTWVAAGSSYVQSDLLAAMLLPQLQAKDYIRERRQQIFQRYQAALAPLAERGLLRLPGIPEHCAPNFHIFYVVLQTAAMRSGCLQALRASGIEATFHYIPLHSSPFGTERYGYRAGDLAVTEDLAARLLRLPIYPDLTEREQQFVIEGLFRSLGCEPAA